ncbi:MAG: DUF2971 domain-containing protein [Pseudomonadota bacterium]
MDETNLKLWQIFFPYAYSRVQTAKKSNTQFVHYTSAETAIKIIRNNEVWMRNALVMNDFAEIEHGKECVLAACHDDVVGTRLSAALLGIDSGIWQAVTELFDKTDFQQRTGTYLISFSEHGDGSVDEDRFGRLSMWRAYGGDTNVALVLNNEPFHAETNALSATTTPVFYANPNDFKNEFLNVVENIEKNIQFLKSQPVDDLVNSIYSMLFYAVLSTKHPGFSEEREWRVIYSPKIYPNERMKYSVEVVGGIPQKVYKLPLNNIPDEGLVGLTVPELLREVVIGPTEYPNPMFEAFVDVMQDAGIPDAHTRIKVSGIPLRR